MSHARTVVVGVDGSEPSRSALVYAMQDAVARGDEIRAIAAVAPPDQWATAYGLPTMPTRDGEFQATQKALETMVAEVVAELGSLVDKVTVTTLAVVGVPAEVMVQQAAGADLLVIGHRGRGRLASAVLGSVGLHCVLKAPCPVTIVRPVARAAG